MSKDLPHQARDYYEQIGVDLGDSDGVEFGQMFGKPCLKIGKKAFAAFFQDAMVFKLGHAEVEDLKKRFTGTVNWDPSGKKRPMKDWGQVPFEYQGEWPKLAQEAMNFVNQA